MKRNFAIPAAILCALLAVTSVSAQVNRGGGTLGIDVAEVDGAARPQDDFFRFVNGRWADKTEIPPDKSRYGSFGMLADESEIALKEIVEEAAAQKNARKGSEVQKVGDLYRSFMDTERIEMLGIKTLQAYRSEERRVGKE